VYLSNAWANPPSFFSSFFSVFVDTLSNIDISPLELEKELFKLYALEQTSNVYVLEHTLL
jgi:hypothetical protein